MTRICDIQYWNCFNTIIEVHYGKIFLTVLSDLTVILTNTIDYESDDKYRIHKYLYCFYHNMYVYLNTEYDTYTFWIFFCLIQIFICHITMDTLNDLECLWYYSFAKVNDLL